TMAGFRILTVFILLIGSNALCVQLRMEAPKPVNLKIIVTFEDGREKVPHATVELMDAVGYGSAMDRKDTDQEGRVEFRTLTGLHRFIITSPTTRRYEGELEIQPNESFHMEVVRVQHDTAAVSIGSTPKELVPAVRLKIPSDARKEFEKGSADMQKQHWA